VATQISRTDEAFYRVPRVSNPGSWSSSRVFLSAPKLTFRDSGWTIIFEKVQGGPQTPIVFPNLLPTLSVERADKVLAAYVVLPEASGDTQYWVSVSEQYSYGQKRFAQLQTACWTVTFLRDPL